MSVARQLTHFRRQIEKETGRPAAEIELPLHLVLDDLCTLFDVDVSLRRTILGRRGVAAIHQYRARRAPKPCKRKERRS